MLRKKAKFAHLDFLDLFEQYQDNNIVDNSFAHEDISEYVASSRKYLIDGSKNVLISLVKRDNFNQYLDKSDRFIIQVRNSRQRLLSISCIILCLI